MVINAADGDSLNLSTAILDGMKARLEATGRRPVLVHISGQGIIFDTAQGALDAAFAANPYDARDVICATPVEY